MRLRGAEIVQIGAGISHVQPGRRMTRVQRKRPGERGMGGRWIAQA
jgi:hypothetical protein